MKQSKKALLLTTGAVVAGAVAAASVAVVKPLVNIAMDRNQPDKMNQKVTKISGTKDTEEAKVLNHEEVIDIQNCETVTIRSCDGLKLVGHWHTCENPKRVIVAMHGWRSRWYKDFGMIADFWHDNDCCALYAEQRAQGDSEGDYMTFGTMERYDCLAWAKWVDEKTEGKLPIYLAGVSMGATTVLLTAGLDLPENVRGIHADCGFTSAHDIWKHVLNNNLHLHYHGLRAAYAEKLCMEKSGVGTQECSTVEAMENCKIPVLLFHGDVDHFVPVEMTYENYKACKAPKTMVIVPGAGHGMSYMTDKTRYEEEVQTFWEMCESRWRANL